MVTSPQDHPLPARKRDSIAISNMFETKTLKKRRVVVDDNKAISSPFLQFVTPHDVTSDDDSVRVFYSETLEYNYSVCEMPGHSDEIEELGTVRGTSLSGNCSKKRIVTPLSSMVSFTEDTSVIPADMPISERKTTRPEELIGIETHSDVRFPRSFDLVEGAYSHCSAGSGHKTFCQPKHPKTELHRRIASLLIVSILLFPKFIGWINSRPLSRTIPDGTVYVPGGGFSGFWFTLGRLQSLPNPFEKKYYCYSAGCLGVVAMLGNYSMDELYVMAKDRQIKWQGGELHRYDVVADFVDGLLFGETLSGAGRLALSPNILSTLHIITSVRKGWAGLSTEVRIPDSLDELRKMLIQTTWIPFAVGEDLWLDDHMDGAFTVGQHPICAYSVGTPLDLDLISNVINMNLSKDKVEKFWNMGLRYTTS